MSLFDLSGKVAVITGSSRGIGRAMALRMAEHGARVVVSSRKAAACEAVAGEIRARGGETFVRACDVSRKADLEALAADVTAHWGRIDVLVCNAAANPYYGPLAGLSDEAMEKTLAANVKGVLWLANLTAPGMAERGGGAIIIVSSIGGFIGSDVLGLYNLTKAAEQSLARSLAYEWGAKNVRVNCIAPGLVRTDFSRALWENPQVMARRVSTTALRRMGEADEIAGAAVFLASAAGAYVTGQTIVVDGGRLIGVLPPDEPEPG